MCVGGRVCMPCVEVRGLISGGRSLLPRWVPGIIRVSREARGPFLFTHQGISSAPFLVFVSSESKMHLFPVVLKPGFCMTKAAFTTGAKFNFNKIKLR